jgi:sarcosine oxidase subunit gamma
MLDAATRAPALTEHRLRHGPHPDAALKLLPPAAQLVFRGPPGVLAAAGEAFGVALPTNACRAATSGARTALWLGPDEWLLLAPALEGPRLQAAIGASLAPKPHALVSVGHRNVALDISGPCAALVLNGGCPLDLRQSSFPAGMCTRTLLAKAPVILWRTAAETFYLGTWRSFAPYVWDFLLEARTRL